MKLFKIKLAESGFWFLDDIASLTKENTMSDFINVELLPIQVVKIIDHASNMREIKLFDATNHRVHKLIDLGYYKGDFSVDTNDVKEDESDLTPEVFSVTIDSEDENEVEDIEPSENDISNAQILLSKNGNTVKKTIKQMTENDSLKFLYACLQVEQEKQNRVGVIQAIDKKIAELLDD